MTVSTLHVTGTRGEVTPLMASRIDTEFIQSAYAKARNVVVTRYGPMTRVPGTRARGRPRINGQRAILLPFEFNEEQIYHIEAGQNYFRFWTPEGQVFDGASPYEIGTPFEQVDLLTLHGRQSGDALYLFGSTKGIFILKRLGETNWTLEPYVAKNGPYLTQNTTATTLTPANHASLTPAMTSNTAPSGQVLVGPNPGTAPAWQVFDKRADTVANWNNVSSWVGYRLPGGAQAVVNAYYVMANPSGQFANTTPISWRIEGSNDGTNWTTIDSRDGQTGWAPNEKRYFEFENKTAYRDHRIRWEGVDGNLNNVSSWAEISFNRAAESQTPFNLVASSVQGINDDQGFLAEDVGRNIRLMGSDGRWRWAEVITRVSATVVTIRLHGHALPDLSPIIHWALGTFRGDKWPFTGTFFDDRLVTGGHIEDPIGMWFSVSAAYDLYRQSQPLVADDAFNLRLTGGTFDAIRWLAESGQLLAGTASVLRSVGVRNQSNVLAHDNARQRSETHVGASAAQPETVENVVLFLDRIKKRLYEAAYSFEADGYLAREVSTLNSHLFSSGVEQIVFLDAPHKLAIVRRTDGKLIFFAYDREQRVAGGTLVDYGGVVEDISVLPGRDYPELWLIVRRTRNGQQERFVETMAPFFDEDESADAPIYAASAYVYDGAPTTGLAGLDNLRGVTVGVWADGRDIGDAVVASDATLVLPHDVEAELVVVGERMPFELRTLRLNQFGQQDGAGLGRHVRIVKTRVDVLQTYGISVGSLRETYPLRHEDDVLLDPEDPVPLRTGMISYPVDDTFQNEGVFVIQGSSMHPATIRAISLDVEGEP